MNVAIYARVSTEWQAEHGYSIGTQIEACRKKAEEMGAFVVKEYIDDGYSGGFLERPALDNLRDAVQDGLYEAVIFHDADRMARKLIHQLILTEELEKAGCRPVFVLERFDNTPEGNMSYQMKGVFAEYERAKIRERTMRGKRAKLRAGKAINDSHIYGYDFDRETCCYVVNPAEAEIVKRVYQWYVVDMVGGCEVIADMLNKQGIPSPTGVKWCASSVRNIIHRPHYTGRYFSNTKYHKKTGPKSYKKIPRPREEWIEMTCPAIIPAELHEKALEIKSKKRTYKTWKKNNDIGLLQGLAYCGHCGTRIRICTDGKRGRRWYQCPESAPRNGGKCPSRYMELPVADALFWSTLEQICTNEETLTAYIGKRADGKTSAAPAQNKRQKIIKRIEKIHSERQAVMAWFSQSLLGQSEATEKLTALKAEESRLQIDLAEIEKNTSAAPAEQNAPADIVAVVRNCPPTLEARRRVVLEILEKVSVIRRDYNYGHKYLLDFDFVFK